MGKEENNQNYSELFNELKTLNSQYKILLAEIAQRGIENAKDSARQWTEEKIETIEQNIKEIPEKLKDAGIIAIAMGISGVEATKKRAKLVIKGAKTSYANLKSKVNRAQLKAKMYKDELKNEAKEKLQKGKETVKDFVDDKKDKVENWAKDKRIIYHATKVVLKDKKDRVIKGVKTFPSNVKAKVDRKVLEATMYQLGLKREARAKIHQGKENVKDFVDNKKEQVEQWVDNKKEMYEATKYAVKQTVIEKKEKIITESKAKAGEFIGKTQEAKLRYEQRRNKTLLGAIKNVRNIATALEGKLEERILTDNEKTEKAQQKQPQKLQKREMGMEM